MYSRINYTVVGLFVVLFSAAVLGFGFWLAKYGFEQRYDRYYLYFNETVDGLTLDSSVKLKGVDVGKVSAIEIDPDNVERIRVLVRLKEGTPITRDMYGVLKLQGITGLSYVQIEGGTQKAGRIRPENGEIGVIPTRISLIQQLGKTAPDLMKKLERAVGSLDAFLSEHNRKQWKRILDNSAAATERAVEVEKKIIALSDDFNRTLREVGKDIHGVSSTLNTRLEPFMLHLEEAGRHISAVSRGIEQRLRRGEYDIKKIVRPLKIDLQELSYRYQELAEDLKRLSRTPSSILFDSTHPMKGPGE